MYATISIDNFLGSLAIHFFNASFVINPVFGTGIIPSWVHSFFGYVSLINAQVLFGVFVGSCVVGINRKLRR